MSLHHCRHIIFDLDGTLTIPVHDFESIRQDLGLKPGEMILEAMEKMPPDEAATVSVRLEEIEQRLAENANPQPKVFELLEHITSAGINVGILTRNGQSIAHTTLEVCGLREFFYDAAIIGRESCSPKPDPAGVHHLIDLWNALAHETAIVGDSLFDLQSGRNAGITTVHFDSTGEFQWPEHTDVFVDTLHDLIEHIA
ncbi:MAG: HAD family hydrolase [Gammaproteobacteria bacterium]|nr:HAD family hydrolase [Gammaproteobacteria bacterium]